MHVRSARREERMPIAHPKKHDRVRSIHRDCIESIAESNLTGRTVCEEAATPWEFHHAPKRIRKNPRQFTLENCRRNGFSATWQRSGHLAHALKALCLKCSGVATTKH
jgi:hypothetical protein